MRWFSPALVLFFLSACAGPYEADEFDLATLKRAVGPLFVAPTNAKRIEIQWWPSEIKELNPQSIMKIEAGIYIKLDSFFVEQRGLFIPSPGKKIEAGVYSDPGYVLLGWGIYSYYVTG